MRSFDLLLFPLWMLWPVIWLFSLRLWIISFVKSKKRIFISVNKSIQAIRGQLFCISSYCLFIAVGRPLSLCTDVTKSIVSNWHRNRTRAVFSVHNDLFISQFNRWAFKMNIQQCVMPFVLFNQRL